MYPTKAAAEGSAPPPSGGAGRSKYSDPKARARHAALVRWKKENPQAANLQERLAQIRAARLKKKGSKGKAKGGKPKDARTPQEKANQNRSTIAKEGGVGDLEGTIVRLGTGTTRDFSLEKDNYDKLISKGMAKRDANGKVTLTSAGRKWRRAADKGDKDGAAAAEAEGAERVGKDREKAATQQQKKAERDKANAERQARQKQRKAKRAKKKTGEPKEKAEKPDKAAQAEKNRKDITDKMAANDEGITSYGRDALQQLADGGGMDAGIVRAQEAMGLVERDSDGKPRATAQGRALLRAIDKGDYGMALDAVSRAKDKVAARQTKDKAKQEREKAKQAKDKAKQERARSRLPGQSPTDRGTGPRKPPTTTPPQAHGKKPAPKPIGRKPQPMERKMADIAEVIIDLETLRDELLEDDAIKAGRRNSGNDQAQIDQGYELAMQLCDLFESLGADTGEEEGEAEGDLEEGLAEEEDEEMEGKAAPTFGGKKRGDLEDSDFADPANRKYPIMSADDVRSAASLIGKAENPDAVKRKIIAIAKRKGFEDALPAAWKEATKKDAAYILDGDAVKALDGDRVGAYAVRFGSEDEPDMSTMRDYFTKATDYWLDAWDRRPMLYHHTMDEDTQDAPRIGTWTKAEIKDEGVWLEGQLDRHHRYYGAIKELVRRGVLRLSSDSAPHLVRRAAKADGIHEVTRWPLMAASLTPTPAEPRLASVSFKALLAEYGINDTDNQEANDTDERERADGLKAAEDRKRRLLLLAQLELEQLEATTL